jgi:hypothetical protein
MAADTRLGPAQASMRTSRTSDAEGFDERNMLQTIFAQAMLHKLATPLC